MSHDIKSHSLTINTNLFKQINIYQMFDKIQMILMMKSEHFKQPHIGIELEISQPFSEAGRGVP